MGSASNKGEELKGRMKEAAGSATGNKDLKREGKKDQTSAKAKDKVDKAGDAVKRGVDPDGGR